MSTCSWRNVAAFLPSLALAALSRADIIVPGADGSDEAFAPSQNVQVDLGLALPRTWDTPSPIPSRGVYDFEKWAVVYKFSSVSIPSNVTVTFRNHPSRAPVVWLVSGDVNIAGTINLDGEGGPSAFTYAEPGPGGFRGGARWASWSAPGSAGFGPGGGVLRDNNGSVCAGYAGYGSQGYNHTTCRSDTATPPTYGNKALLPLIGGSGGGPWSNYGGSAGGGAILIASTRTINITGGIRAYGGPRNQWAGSGGAIRLVAQSVAGTGYLRAQSWDSQTVSLGRIRIEANPITMTDFGSAIYSCGLPGATAVLWPTATAPTVRIVSVGGQAAPTDPRASLDFPRADVTLTDSQWALVLIEATNVPLSWNVDIRVVAKQGQDFTVGAVPIGGDDTASTWQAYVTLPSGFASLQVRAHDPAAVLREAESEEEEQPGDLLLPEPLDPGPASPVPEDSTPEQSETGSQR